MNNSLLQAWNPILIDLKRYRLLLEFHVGFSESDALEQLNGLIKIDSVQRMSEGKDLQGINMMLSLVYGLTDRASWFADSPVFTEVALLHADVSKLVTGVSSPFGVYNHIHSLYFVVVMKSSRSPGMPVQCLGPHCLVKIKCPTARYPT